MVRGHEDRYSIVPLGLPLAHILVVGYVSFRHPPRAPVRLYRLSLSVVRVVVVHDCMPRTLAFLNKEPLPSSLLTFGSLSFILLLQTSEACVMYILSLIHI